MATLQAKTSRGHTYGYIVESRRVHGKPRPVVLAYLGKAETLLQRLQGRSDTWKIKSYSHGAVAALLHIAHTLDVATLINHYIAAQRPYMASKPHRHQLTAGITLLLGAIGRVCMPTSKRGWWPWAKTTSLEYLLRSNLSQVDSQHFWDLMDCLPVSAIAAIERDLLQRLWQLYELDSDTVLFDTTNFYTYIHSENSRCRIAQRGRNKQKRHDLRQVGLAMVVTRQDFIPLFHLCYEGQLHDSVVFAQVLDRIKQRLVDLHLDVDQHTLVFDRGCNSKKNLQMVQTLRLHYVGALTPYHHQQLLRDAEGHYVPVQVREDRLYVDRDKHQIWGGTRTVVVFVSEQLKAGQVRGIYQALHKQKQQLAQLQTRLANPSAKKRRKDALEAQIEQVLHGQYMAGLIEWNLQEVSEGRFQLQYGLNTKKLAALEDTLGFRMLMTDRHEWTTAEIITCYYGQAAVEQAFKNIKHPYHLAITPEFHWTEQKIRVHFFLCVLGYQLATILWRVARLQGGFHGTLDHLLDTLSNIRLATLLAESQRSGRMQATYKLEEMTREERALMEVLGLMDFHITRPHVKGVSVYD